MRTNDRDQSRRVFAIVLVGVGALLLASTVHGQPAVAPDRAQATQPSTQPTTLPVDDIARRVKNALASPEELTRELHSIEVSIGELLKDPARVDPVTFTEVVALREFARYFLRIEETSADQRTTMRWLLDQPNLRRTLMLAVSRYESPDRMLRVLNRLRLEHEPKLERWHELVTAFCVVWDRQARDDGDEDTILTNLNHATGLFHFYTAFPQHARFSLLEMPWQLSIFVVENEISEAELAWALKQFAARQNLGATYLDVPYDRNQYFTGRVSRQEGTPYTLQNIQRQGGVCEDQAYFATMVSRSFAVPAVVVSGVGGLADASHAWVGYLRIDRGRLYWDFEVGRYEEHLYWSGTTIDPQTRQPITEADVALTARYQSIGPRERNASRALVKSIDLAPTDQQFALAARAVELCPANREAWLLLAELGASRQLTEDQSARLFDAVHQYLVGPFPDFALTVLRRSIEGRGNIQQFDLLERLANTFRARPDLVARIRIAQGDLLARERRAGDALAVYGDVLTTYILAGPIILTAMDRVDALLREHHELRRLAAIYRQTVQRMPQPSQSAYIRTTPYYALSTRYMLLLTEIGNHAEASRVRQRLDALDSTADSQMGVRRR
jgi:hypothetical protein